jgi:hypothetical protein
MRFYYPQRNGSTKKRMERVRFSIFLSPSEEEDEEEEEQGE